jgi:Casein kinase II regulatory subunit
MFCEVERSYIEDGFNLYGLRACVSNFSDCLDLILDRIGPDDSDDSHLTQSACTLYGLIHARYIITAHGLDAMYNKVRALCIVRGYFSCCIASFNLSSLFFFRISRIRIIITDSF